MTAGIWLKMKRTELDTAEIVLKAILKLEVGKFVNISDIDRELKSKMDKEHVRMGLTTLLECGEIKMPSWEVFIIDR